MKISEMWQKKEKVKGNKEVEKKDKSDEEMFKNLPPGVKIKKIEIGPKNIIKWLIYIFLFWWMISFLGESLVK